MSKSVNLKFLLVFDLLVETEDEFTDSFLIKNLKHNPKKRYEYRAPPHLFSLICEHFKNEGFEIQTDILKRPILSDLYRTKIRSSIKLRGYQQESYDLFFKNKGRGVIVLPTAAGKTVIGLKIIEGLQQKTLVVVPTKNLLYQWIESLTKYTSLTKDMIGQLGDKIKEIKEITVTTYDSARLNINLLRKEFSLLVLDECHHSVAEETTKVLEGFPAKHRLGLTATPERTDERESILFHLIGPKIAVTRASELSKQGYVAEFELKTIKVQLTDEEREKYNELMSIYKTYLRQRNIQIRSPRDYERFLIFRVNIDPQAKEAVDAHRKARNLVFSSRAKLNKVEKLLEKHSQDHVILFSEFNEMVYTVSRRNLIPAITHETKTSERKKILKKFTNGKYTKIITGKVLDEGFDVQKANVGIIISGTSVARQFVQRLGRLLRPKEGKAVLYELVTPDTLESKTATRRKKTEMI